jgi:hypothetical protein
VMQAHGGLMHVPALAVAVVHCRALRPSGAQTVSQESKRPPSQQLANSLSHGCRATMPCSQVEQSSRAVKGPGWHPRQQALWRPGSRCRLRSLTHIQNFGVQSVAVSGLGLSMWTRQTFLARGGRGCTCTLHVSVALANHVLAWKITMQLQHGITPTQQNHEAVE